MVIWVMILIIIGDDDSTKVLLNFPVDYKYNTQEICMQQSELRAYDLEKLNPTYKKVGWMCKPINFDQIEKALPPKV